MKFLILYNIKINYIRDKKNVKANAFNKRLDYNTKIPENL